LEKHRHQSDTQKPKIHKNFNVLGQF